MKKRIIAAIICFSMLLTVMGTAVFADTAYTRAPGEFEFYQDMEAVVNAENAVFDGEFINISAGGYAEYEFTLPFDAKTLDIAYKVPESATLILDFPTNSYAVDLEIGKYNISIDLAPEQLGDLKLKLSSDKRVLVSELKYTKIDDVYVGSDDVNAYAGVVDYSDYQKSIQKAVVLMEGSTAIKTRNLTRYINMDDTFEAPSYIDGSMYLPVNTYAKAFGYYMEDYPELNYVYMSGDDFSFYFTDSESYFEKAGNKTDINNLVRYQNGKAYLPVRAISEMLGYTVIYNDGVIIIDKKLAAEAISADRAVMTNLKKELKAYIPAAERGKTYHVSKAANASNLNSGTAEEPFATVQMAANMAKAGDTVIIHEGIYRETVTVKNSGSASNPIIFKPADGEIVTISAFDEVTHFAPYTNEQNGVQMYMSDINGYEFTNMLDGCWDVDRNFVLYNGEMLTEGRHPNKKTSAEKTSMRFNGSLNKTENPEQLEEFTAAKVPDFNSDYPEFNNHKLLPVQGDMRIKDVTAIGLAGLIYNHKIESDIDLTAEAPDYWKDSIYVGLVGEGLQPSAIQVISSKKGEATASEVWKGEAGTVTYNQDKKSNDYGFLTHHINTVDMPGEWYIDNVNGQFFVIPPAGADPGTMKFEIKTRQVVFDLTSKKYVQIHNINTRGGGITMADAQGCVLNGGTHKYISQFDISAMYDTESLDNIYKRLNPYTEEPVFEGGPDLTSCDISGETGFALSGLYNAIVNTDIEYAAGAGISVTGSYNYLENNKIDKTGYGATSQSGIYVSGRHQVADQPCGGHQIYQNTSTGAGRACFAVENMIASAPIDVAFNEFAYGMMMARDGGNVIFDRTLGGTEFNPANLHHNNIHDTLGGNTEDVHNRLIYIGSDVGMYDIDNNLLYFSTSNETYVGSPLEFKNEDASADIDKWSNIKAVFDASDKVNFTPADYPAAYPFMAGARDKADRCFMTNYNKDKFAYVLNLDGSAVAQGIKVAGNGSKISLFYTSDRYLQDAENVTKTTVEFYKNGQLVGTEEVELYAHAPGRVNISKAVLYASAKYAGCDMFKVSSSNGSINYISISVSDNTFDEENEKPPVVEEENTDVVVEDEASDEK